jgi:hypothetical protein
MNDTEVRCTCRVTPLLAVCREDGHGSRYLHIKSTRNRRTDVSVVVTEGDVRIQCRVCSRWTTVKVRRTDLTTRRESLPDSIQV